MHMRDLRSALYFSLVLAWAPLGPVAAEVTVLDAAALAGLDQSEVTVIDVRRPDEWSATGIIEGALPLTFFDARGHYDIEAWLAAVDEEIESRDAPVVLVCEAGIRSSRIAMLLDQRLGFTAVSDLGGGMRQWRREGRQVISWVPAEPDSLTVKPADPSSGE